MFEDLFGFMWEAVKYVLSFVFVMILFVLVFGILGAGLMAIAGDPDATTIKQETVQGKVIESADNSSISANFNIDDMAVVEVTYEDAEGKKQNGYLLINKDSEVVVDDFYSDYEGVPLKGIILNEE